MNEVTYLLDRENGFFEVRARFRSFQSDPVFLDIACHKSEGSFTESDPYKEMCVMALELLTGDLEKAHNTYLTLKELPVCSLDFKMYGSIDYLTDHHHGDREELIGLSYLPSDEEDLRTMLVDALKDDLTKYPAELSVPQAKAIVADADASVLHGFAQIPSDVLTLVQTSEDGYDSDGVSLWFLLTW